VGDVAGRSVEAGEEMRVAGVSENGVNFVALCNRGDVRRS